MGRENDSLLGAPTIRDAGIRSGPRPNAASLDGASSGNEPLDLPDEDRKIGPFLLVQQLGKGGFGSVWRAVEVHGKRTLREAAVKLFPFAGMEDGAASPPQLKAMVLDEARALCRVEHPNIVRFYQILIDDDKGWVGIAMEYVPGTSLRDKITRREGALGISIEETLTVGTMVASALSAVHRAGLVHRDIKPDNVVEHNGVYKLIDFGIAVETPFERRSAPSVQNDNAPLSADSATLPAGAHASSSSFHRVSGTVGYIDPLCFAAGARPTAASDLYGLGALLFECVTGALPALTGMGPGKGPDYGVLHGSKRAPRVLDIAPTTPPDLARLIDSLLAPQPSERPKSAEQVAHRLDQIRSALSGLARSLPAESLGPFRGLGRFEDRDRGVYFGRSAEITAAIEVLRSHGVVSLVGPSGSGKSSLARAGVLPRVAEGALGGWPKLWDTCVVVPGGDARAALTTALGKLEPPLKGAADLNPDGLLEALVERAHTVDRGLVILLDQLEELVTLSSGESRDWAASLLAKLGSQVNQGVCLIQTVRRDQLDRLVSVPDLGKVLGRGLLPIEPIREVVWAEIVDQALGAYGYSFEDDKLREEVLNGLEGAHGAMPLAQFALTELWNERDTKNKRITRAKFLSIGGLAGALDKHAETSFKAFVKGRPWGEEAVRRVLLALTSPDGTRVKRRLEEIEREHKLGKDIVSAFEKMRLITCEADGVTLAHEALLTQWSRLRSWLWDVREDRMLAEEIERDAARWRREPDAIRLLSARRLAGAEEILERESVGFSEEAMTFIQKSKASAKRQRWVRRGVAAFIGVCVALSWVLYERARDARERELRERERTAQEAKQKAEEALREIAEAQEKTKEALARAEENNQRAEREKQEKEREKREKESVVVKSAEQLAQADKEKKALLNLVDAQRRENERAQDPPPPSLGKSPTKKLTITDEPR